MWFPLVAPRHSLIGLCQVISISLHWSLVSCSHISNEMWDVCALHIRQIHLTNGAASKETELEPQCKKSEKQKYILRTDLCHWLRKSGMTMSLISDSLTWLNKLEQKASRCYALSDIFKDTNWEPSELLLKDKVCRREAKLHQHAINLCSCTKCGFNGWWSM